MTRPNRKKGGWLEGPLDYMVKTRGLKVPRATAKRNDLCEIDATEPLGLRFERSVARRLGCR